MAIVAITTSKITLATVEYSNQISSSSLDLDVEALDTTNFDSAGWKAFIGGAKSGTLNIEWKRDTNLSGLNSALWTALGTVIAFTYQLNEETIATTMPEWQGSILINKESIGAGVNQLWSFSSSFPTSGAITRDVTP